MMRASIVFALALLGCAPEYAYVPVENATSQISGQTAAAYPIPPEAPQGDVRIASFGLTPLRLSPDETVPALHVRMTVADRSDASWTVDTREQICAIGGEGQSRPIFASADQGGLPLLAVTPQSERTIDLFYPLPHQMHQAQQVPQFDLLWQVNASTRVVAMRTPFERIAVERGQVAYAAPYAGPGWWGPYWWYDPLYVDFTFVHPFFWGHAPAIVGPRIVGPPPPRLWVRPPVVGGRPPVIVRPPVMVRPPAGRRH